MNIFPSTLFNHKNYNIVALASALYFEKKLARRALLRRNDMSITHLNNCKLGRDELILSIAIKACANKFI